MSVLYTPAAALLAALTLVPIQATAHWFDGFSCSLDFSRAVAVTPELVRIHSNGSELIVTASNSLLVDGRVIDLNDAQRDRVAEYVGEIRTTMLDVVEVALEGVEIGLTAAAEVAGAVFGSRPPADLYVLMDEVRERVGQRMYDRDGSIYLNGDGIDALDETMADLEPRIDEIMSRFVGSALSAAGQAFSDGEGSFVERMEAFGARMERFQRDMDMRVGERAAGLEARAEELCDHARALSFAEDALQQSVPEVRDIDLTRMSGGVL